MVLPLRNKSFADKNFQITNLYVTIAPWLFQKELVGNQLKELHKTKKRCMARHGKKFGSRLSKQAYLDGKWDSQSYLKRMGTH